jgi:acetylornithine deacetylase
MGGVRILGRYPNVEIQKDRLLWLTQNLIQIESVNPKLVPGGSGETKIAHFIGDLMKNAGFSVYYQDLGSGRTNVISVLEGVGGGKSLMLNGHIDTVGIKDMQIPPLEGRYDGSKVYGRGSFDMKGGVAAMLQAAMDIKRSNIKLKGDLVLACVCDEEYMSIGSEAVSKEFPTDAAIVCEPTGLQLVLAHKGFAWITVDVLGKASHGSLPDEGIDAIAKAGKLLCVVDKMTSENLSKKSHPLLGSPSIHASLIEGGTELSTYPDHCRIQLERRTIPNETEEDVKDEMSSILKGLRVQDPKFNADFELFFYREPFEVDKDEPIVRVLFDSYRSLFNKSPEVSGAAPWLDSAILQKSGISTVVFGPSGFGAHSAVEYVDFESVVSSAEIYANATLRYCGVV